MNETIKTILTPDIIRSYAKACVTLCDDLLDLQNENFKRIILPSRGAYPFYQGAINSLHLIADFREVMDFNTNYNLWLLPYTSDWGTADLTIDSEQIRKFWTKILSDAIRKEKTPYTIFYNTLVKTIGNQYTINTSDLLLNKFYKKDSIDNERFIFIDTAISGRAICEIIESFKTFNLQDYFILLIVDNNGTQLHPKYKTIIEKEKSEGRLKQINVLHIFSEDASPILNGGISSLVFPSLMEQSFHEIKEFYDNGFIGAGLWFIDSVSHLRAYNSNLNGVRGIFFTTIFSGISEILLGKNVFFEHILKMNIERALQWSISTNLFDSNSTKKLVYDRIVTRGVRFKEDVNVSSSHVVRINLNKDQVSSFIKQVNKKIG